MESMISVALMAAIVGGMIGISLYRRYQEYRVTVYVDALEKAIEAQNENTINVKVEIDQGIIYIYDKITNKFLFQSKTVAELKEILARDFPGKNVLTSADDMNKLKDHESI